MAELILIKGKILVKGDKQDATCLHENINQSLFQHKEMLCNAFNDIRGTFFIDHFSVYIFNQNKKIVIFSVTPSVEYNLIRQDLWKYDRSFFLNTENMNSFYSWEEAYEKIYFDELKLVKQISHGFCFGFNLIKIVESEKVVYSFATRHEQADFVTYYHDYTGELLSIGDYLYKSISGIYKMQFKKNNDRSSPPSFPFLKLVIGNKQD